MTHIHGLEGHLYDWENGLTLERQNLDIGFYLGLLRRFGANARVLELGCGTGRITIPLADAGYRVTGVDTSADRLSVARDRAGGNERVRLVDADMCEFQDSEGFELVFVPYSSFLLLPDRATRIRCLQNIATLVARGGLAVIDLSPNFPHHEVCSEREELQGFYAPLNADITLWVSISQDPERRITAFRKRYRIAVRLGACFEVVYHETWHTLTIDDMRVLLRDVPLQIDEVLGTYAGAPLFVDGVHQRESYKNIYVLRRSG